MRINTRQIKFLLFLLLIGLFISSCEDQNKTTPEKNLPEEARDFLKQNLPNYRIVSIEKNEVMAMEPTMYFVSLEGGISVLFGEYGRWYYTESRNGLPESALIMVNGMLLDKLKEKEAGVKIIRLSPLLNSGILIELSNGKRYTRGFGFESNESNSLEICLPESDIPQTIKEFLMKYNMYQTAVSGYVIRINESQGDVYRVVLNEYFWLGFDKDGKWIHGRVYETINGGKQLLSKIAVGELPENVISAINSSEETLGSLLEVSCYKNDIYGLRFSTKSLLANKEKGIIQPPTEAAQKLVDKYFQPNQFEMESLSLHNPYRFDFGYRYRYKNNYLLLNMGANNKWQSIFCITNVSSVARYVILPGDLIKNELPSKIVDYLNANYIQPKVYALGHTNNEYAVGVEDASEILYFDEVGNFIRKEMGLK